MERCLTIDVRIRVPQNKEIIGVCREDEHPRYWQVSEEVGWTWRSPHGFPLQYVRVHTITTCVIHPSTKSPLAGASASCCYAQSNILSNDGGVAWSGIRVALIWGSAPNLFLAISVIKVVLSIRRSYITEGNYTFLIPLFFSYQMRICGRYFKAS